MVRGKINHMLKQLGGMMAVDETWGASRLKGTPWLTPQELAKSLLPFYDFFAILGVLHNMLCSPFFFYILLHNAEL